MPDLPQSIFIFGICKTAHAFTWKEKTQTQMPDVPLKFYHASDLAYHIKTQHEQNEKVKCIGCDKLYKTIKLMKAHFNDVHMQVKKFKCLHCGDKFGSSIALFRHKEKVI